jgi:hypothetical protein
MRRLPLVLAATAAAAFACATRTGGFDSTPGDDAGAPPGGDAGALGDVVAVDAARSETLLYTHDNTSLYRIDPKDPKLGLQKVGDFDCIVNSPTPPPLMGNAMTDIAVDRDGRLFGIASYTIFLDMQISGTTVGCKANAKQLAAEAGAVKFYGASFAPAGTLDPRDETLIVANTDGELFAVDTLTGALTLVGTFGNVPSSDGNGHNYPSGNVGKAWELSGDIVFAENAGKPIGFATVRDCPNPPTTNNCNTIDTLVELDLSRLSTSRPGVVVKSVRGQIRKAQGCPDGTTGGYGSMFGIAAFGSDVLGFSRDGLIVRVNNNDGSACLVSDASGQFVDPNKGFNGAGVTTKVSVTTPPPR